MLTLFQAVVFTAILSAQTSNDYGIKGVPFNQVKLDDAFWLPRVEINRTVTIPASFKKCEETGRIKNFQIAAGKDTGKFQTTFPFDDTDPYKIIEGASYSLQIHPDPSLDRYLDSLIAIIASAQEPDGYLYTSRTIDPDHPHKWSGNERWVNESNASHELYNSGHLFEAASAHYLATGKRNLLDVALKNADLLCKVFGPGKRSDAPGHEIVEMGLVRLYRITGEQKYLDLAKFFIDCRGAARNPDRTYFQDQLPVVEQTEAVGHAVRAGYLYSGMADVAALTGNTGYTNAIDMIWENVVTKKLYITGGIGAVPDGERFGQNYELPNLTAYNETCAAIANVYWNYRMFLLHGDAKYIDVLERSLYNNVAAGVSLDGSKFFYPNPLESDGQLKFNMGSINRQPWFDCSCCPTNVCRFMSSLAGYIYAQRQNNIYVNLFTGSNAEITLDNDHKVKISQETEYPWQGKVKMTLLPGTPFEFNVLVRIPGWSVNQPVPGDLYTFATPGREKPEIRINGKRVEYYTKNGYALLNRTWNAGDVIELSIPMPVQKIAANYHVTEDKNKLALERGPLVYCIETIDNQEFDNAAISADMSFSYKFEPSMLNGIGVINADLKGKPGATSFRAIPYYAWNNRGDGRMKVWLPVK